jgi:hypothetical protein
VQSIDLGLETDQATNHGYASSYDLKLEGEVKPGSGLQKALKQVIDDDAVGVSFSIKGSIPISESPKGTLTVDKTRVGLGDSVVFTVALTPPTASYWLVSSTYNVDSIVLYRKKVDETEFTPWATITPSATAQTTFQKVWTPEATDVGKAEYAAFVRTVMAGNAIPDLEVGANTVQSVEVGCFTSTALRAGVVAAAVPICADRWVGTSTTLATNALATSASVSWDRDLGFQDPSNPALVRYFATGSMDVQNIVYDNMGCTVTPTHFDVANTSAGIANFLLVDYGVDPPQYGASGIVSTTVNISCNGDGPVATPAQYTWLNAVGAVSEGGLAIAGSDSRPEGGYSYRFVRP